jgi:hypothetical protein
LNLAQPELEKAGVYLGLEQVSGNQAKSSSVLTSNQPEVSPGVLSNTSTASQPGVTVSTARRGRKKVNE